MTIIGREDLIDDPRLDDPAIAVETADEINAVISEWTRRKTKFEVMKMLGEAGVPASACFNAVDIYADAHLREREMIVSVNHPERGDFTLPGCPVKLSDSPVEFTAAPLLGQHNAEVYAEFFGHGADDLAALKARRVI